MFGISSGVILGLYDYWTKRAMHENPVLPIVFWSSLFGAIAWFPAFIPASVKIGVYVDVSQTSWIEQSLIFIKSGAMTASWLLAYYSVRELPMSFSGAMRASGPLWTFIGGLIIFGELLSISQFLAVMISILAYYILSVLGKKEGITVIKSWPIFMMLVATILSAMTTVYDKYIVQELHTPIYAIQAYSALYRCVLAAFVLCVAHHHGYGMKLQWNLSIPLVGISWVVAELVYFFAIADPDANVTYLSIFRRTSLIVGFILSALLIGENNVKGKTLVITLIILSTMFIIFNQ